MQQELHWTKEILDGFDVSHADLLDTQQTFLRSASETFEKECDTWTGEYFLIDYDGRRAVVLLGHRFVIICYALFEVEKGAYLNPVCITSKYGNL